MKIVRNYNLEHSIIKIIRNNPKSRTTDIVSKLKENPIAIIESIGNLVCSERIIHVSIHTGGYGFVTIK